MDKPDRNKHWQQALQWSREANVEPAELISSCIGMGVPVCLFAAWGHLPLGMIAALGGITIGEIGLRPGLLAQGRRLAGAVLPTMAASFLALLLTGHGWLSDVLFILMACLAAVMGGYSRSLVVAATRFILFLAIATNVFSGAPHPGVFLLLILAGAAWRAGTSLAVESLLNRMRPKAPNAEDLKRKPTASQALARWKKSLTQLAGWQYTLRLGCCLGLAEGIRWVWPGHHFYWIVLTAAILTERKADPVPVKTIQRVTGTVIGVAAVSALFAYTLPEWAVVVAVGLLAGLRPWLKARNYLLYSATMTPLIFLLMDAGKPLDGLALLDRITATLIGAALVVLVNLIFTRPVFQERN
ncbi:hypothetical protein GCM10023310_16000 [Paenibacillus vulneris]|uniref:FUSC family protein n=1 Tax=Paenibacillus vulneris TaxID=1133364 RepID=A0ABW3UJR0_9BACL